MVFSLAGRGELSECSSLIRINCLIYRVAIGVHPVFYIFQFDAIEANDRLFLQTIECRNSKDCAPAKHHFDDCVERVTRNSEDPDFKGPHEDCVEECQFLPDSPSI